jgi:prolyl-tRNA editing enzyme YbaK/EbsC (Cys-tRNA(Pro) deacylase)
MGLKNILNRRNARAYLRLSTCTKTVIITVQQKMAVADVVNRTRSLDEKKKSTHYLKRYLTKS